MPTIANPNDSNSLRSIIANRMRAANRRGVRAESVEEEGMERAEVDESEWRRRSAMANAMADGTVVAREPVPSQNAYVCTCCSAAWDLGFISQRRVTRMDSLLTCPACETTIEPTQTIHSDAPWAARGYRVRMGDQSILVMGEGSPEQAILEYLTRVLFVRHHQTMVQRSGLSGRSMLTCSNNALYRLARGIGVDVIYGSSTFVDTREGIYRPAETPDVRRADSITDLNVTTFRT